MPKRVRVALAVKLRAPHHIRKKVKGWVGGASAAFGRLDAAVARNGRAGPSTMGRMLPKIETRRFSFE